MSRLQAVFRRALQVAFASSLMAAGCASTHDDVLGEQGSADTGTGSAVAGAPSGGRASTPSAGDARSQPVAGKGSTTPTPGPRDAGPQAPRDAGGPVDREDSGSPSSPDAGSGVPPVCDPDWKMLAELSPAEPFDYASYRTLHMQILKPQEHAREGTPCANATDASVCESKIELTAADVTQWPHGCGQVGPCLHYIVTTRADEVKHFTDVDQVEAFLGSIDRPQEALLLLQYLGYQISCETTRVWTAADGFEATVQKAVSDCPVQMANVRARVKRSGEVSELSRELLPASNLCIGRRPEGLTAATAPSSRSELGDHFASIAQLEAASIAAFDVLARELEAHAAPASLIEWAREAAWDEVRHAARTSQLARRFGATPQAPRVESRPFRGLEALALDNAVEGCVRETFGAAVGGYQARTARDPEIAALMTEIADDETRHAALALAIHHWVWPRLSDAARETISRARADVVHDLARELQWEPSLALRELAGVPDAATAAKLHEAVRREL